VHVQIKLAGDRLEMEMMAFPCSDDDPDATIPISDPIHAHYLASSVAAVRPKLCIRQLGNRKAWLAKCTWLHRHARAEAGAARARDKLGLLGRRSQ
jgi:hypothetical protein